MPRPTRYHEKFLVRFTAGTIGRIKRLVGEYGMAELVREAVERELRRRERERHRRDEGHQP